MIDHLNVQVSSKPLYIQIIPFGMMPNLVSLGTTLITSGYQQNLQFNPGND